MCIFGGLAGAGIFTAQYFGQKDDEGIRHTFRYKIWIALILTLGAILIFIFGGETLIQVYLNGNSDGGDLQAALMYGKKYLSIMMFGLPAFMLLQVYVCTLRECGETVIPMKAGLCAVFCNLVLDYLLIFGKFGFPQLGVAGAAIATVISRFVEMLVVAGWVTFNRSKNQFIIGAFKSFRVPKALCLGICAKGLPLMINETLWAAGIATVNQCYSVRGLNVVSGITISQTFFNVFSVAFFAVGVAIGIILGQQLGSGDTDKVKDTARHLMTFSVLISVGIGAIYYVAAEFIPLAYNVNDEIKILATSFMQISALTMPFEAYVNAAYFTLRSGGKTVITFLFDSLFVFFIMLRILWGRSSY